MQRIYIYSIIQIQRLINAREGVPNDAKIINQKRSLLLAFVETIIIKSLNE